MIRIKWKEISRSISGKVILAFSVTLVAILLSWALTRIVFKDISDSMREMTLPNENLTLLNRLLEQVTRLDQLQRVQALKKPDKTRSFLIETQKIRKSLDTLCYINTDNQKILIHIDSMRAVLNKRDKVYMQYLKLRTEQVNNQVLAKRINALSSLIQANAALRDHSVISTEKHTVITSVPQKQVEEESFFKRLFGRKQKLSEEPKLITQEFTKINSDTVTHLSKDSLLNEITLSMKRLQQEQVRRNSALLSKELMLLSNGNSLVNELWILLHHVQEDELKSMKTNTETVLGYLEESINRTGMVLLLSFLLLSVLVFLTLTDISKSNLYRKQLQVAKEEAEQLGQAKQRFLSNMSHEIRTPLQSIIGFSEQVKDQHEPEKKMLENIHASANHLLQIVNEVLDYSRITSGKFELDYHPFNAYTLFEEVADTMRLQAQKKGIGFHFSNAILPDSHYQGDDFRLRQVLYNIIGNAIKFTQKGSVHFSVKSTDNAILITISDTGMGISEADLQRVFNEFEQTDNSITRKFGGTGLGLSISKTLVEAMRGTLTVKSKPEKGTRFTLKIPFEKTVVISAESSLLPTQQPATPIIHKVAVVDDDAFILDLCATIIGKHHIPYKCYHSAEAFLEETAFIPEVVFVDIRLSGMSGTELCKRIKQKPNAPFVIALTAQVLPDEREKILEHGFDALLLKPFREHEFIACLRRENIRQELNHTETGEIGIDLSGLMKMSMNDEALMKKHLLHFIRDTQSDIKLLQRHLETQNIEQMIEVSHRLAGRSGQIGSQSLLRKFRAAEIDLQKPAASGLHNKIFEELITETLTLTDQLARYLQKDAD